MRKLKIQKEEMQMKTLIKTLILRNGARLCALAAIVSQIAPYCCRGNYYEPEVPEGIRELRKEGVYKR